MQTGQSTLSISQPKRSESQIGSQIVVRDASFGSDGQQHYSDEGEQLFDQAQQDIPEVVREFQVPTISKGKVLDKHTMKFDKYFWEWTFNHSKITPLMADSYHSNQVKNVNKISSQATFCNKQTNFFHVSLLKK